MRQRDEVEGMATVIADLDKRLLGVRLHDRADRSGGPAAGIDGELDDVENWISCGRHSVWILAGRHGMSTHVEVRRGGESPSTIQVVTTGSVAPLRPSIDTTTS